MQNHIFLAQSEKAPPQSGAFLLASQPLRRYKQPFRFAPQPRRTRISDSGNRRCSLRSECSPQKTLSLRSGLCRISAADHPALPFSPLLSEAETFSIHGNRINPDMQQKLRAVVHGNPDGVPGVCRHGNLPAARRGNGLPLRTDGDSIPQGFR